MNNLSLHNKYIIFLLVLNIIFFPGKISLAGEFGRLSLFPDHASFLDQEKISIAVVADTAGQAINTFQIKLAFDQAIISFDSAANLSPLCGFYRQEITGENFVEITCFSPQVIFPERTKLLDLEFKKISTGWAKLNLADSQLLAHDGLGTNILESGEIHNIYIVK